MLLMLKLRCSLAFVGLTGALLLTGCPAFHQSPPARAQEAATELNVNARFGRMEMAVERVAPKARDAFIARRKAWGANVRVADYELAGLSMKGEQDAEMLVKVAWYRIDQGDLRVTMLKQKWHDFKGAWQLVDEVRADGDVGLIGEFVPAATASSSTTSGGAGTTTTNAAGAPPTRHAQFPTIRLGAAPPEAPATIPPREAPPEEAATPSSPSSP